MEHHGWRGPSRPLGAQCSLALCFVLGIFVPGCGSPPPKARSVNAVATPSFDEETLDTDAKATRRGDDLSATACKAQGQVLESRTRFNADTVAPGTACQSEEQKLTCTSERKAEWVGTYGFEVCVVDPTRTAPVIGATPAPVIVVERRVAFEKESVPYGQRCISEEQTRKVSDGVPGAWTGTFGAEECRAELPIACVDLDHGQYRLRTRYKDPEVPSGTSCVAEVQKQECRNGELLAYTGTFKNDACMVLGKKSCGNTPNGGKETRVRFKTADVPFGTACQTEEQIRSCNDGAFSAWSGSFGFDACSVDSPSDCGPLSHGQSETRQKFQAATVPFGDSCRSERQSRSCENGTLTIWSGTFSFDACLPEAPKSCGNTSHLQFESRTKYRTTSVPYGQTCEEEVQKRQCSNGTFGGWSGSYAFGSCQVSQAASCDTTPHLGRETRTRYMAPSVPFGQICRSEDQSRACTNGTFGPWTGSSAFDTCAPVAPADCGAIKHSQFESRIRYQEEVVPFGQVCVSETQTRTCANGELSTWAGTYGFATCRSEAQPTPRPTPEPTVRPTPEPTAAPPADPAPKPTVDPEVGGNPKCRPKKFCADPGVDVDAEVALIPEGGL